MTVPRARQAPHRAAAVVSALAVLLVAAGCAPERATPPADIALTIGPPTGKVLTPLHFGANVEFFRPGLFAGTLPAGDPRSKRSEFADALRQSGIRALRLPGGNAAYYYLPESRERTMRLAGAKPGESPERFPRQYVLSPTCAANRLLSRLVGCRVCEARLGPDDGTTRAIAGSDRAGRAVIVVVRRSAEAATLALPGLRVQQAEALTADGLDAVLPGQYRVAPLEPFGRRRDRIRLPPWAVVCILATAG